MLRRCKAECITTSYFSLGIGYCDAWCKQYSSTQ